LFFNVVILADEATVTFHRLECAPRNNDANVIAGHSRSKNGVASLAHAGNPSLFLETMDTRVKPAYDAERNGTADEFAHASLT
jgi:hypothetical protein